MGAFIKNWLKFKLAGEELRELYYLQRRTEELRVWCSHNKIATTSARYLQDPTSYPYQCRGYHGSIEDFRAYLDKISKEG
ncbi:conserved hypothetical protein [Vibrio phage 424E50-1]|nr:conserved hypothetical protein [Vibrio phage 424E50-1]